MARIDTPIHSDDEFDLVYDAASSVSDLTDPQVDVGGQSQASPSANTHYTTTTSAERLSGPHEVPVLPHPSREDDAAAATREVSRHGLDDDSRARHASLPRSSSSTKGKGNLMNDGLQYTKSVYNKLWSKDALIAVMG